MNKGGLPGRTYSGLFSFKSSNLRRLLNVGINIVVILSLILSFTSGLPQPVRAASDILAEEVKVSPLTSGAIQEIKLHKGAAARDLRVKLEPDLPGLVIRFDPPYIPLDGKVQLTWELENVASVEGTNITILLPPEMLPEGEVLSSYDPANSKLNLDLTSTSGSVPLNRETASAANFYPVISELMIEGKSVALNHTVLYQIEEHPVTPKGGVVSALGETLEIVFPEDSVDEETNIHVRYWSDQEGGSYLPNGGRLFELTARTNAGNIEVNKFATPLTLRIKYNPALVSENVKFVSVFYYDEKLSSWVTIPSTVDPKDGVILANVEHFTLFGYDFNNLKASLPADIQAF